MTEEQKAKDGQEGPGLEEAFEQIEKLLEKLGDRDVSLEESFRLYQEGMELLKLCSDRIDRVEKRMLQIDEEGQIHEFF